RRNRDDGVHVDFVDPHFVLEKTKETRLRLLKRIVFTGAAIDPNSESDADTDKKKREEDRRLNQEMRVKARRVSGQISFEPRPGRGENETKKNRAKRQRDQRKYDDARAFLPVF